MRDLIELLKEFIEFIVKKKYYWLVPALLALIIFWLLISTAGQTSVPVFVYPVV